MDPVLPNRNNQNLNIVVIISTTIFWILSILGNYGPALMTNDKCYILLGCNNGFFGYDALVHFFSGIMEASLIIWLSIRFPPLSLFHSRFWKNFLVVITMVAFIAFAWEFFEFSHDQFRMKIMRENLLMPNTLDQPTNTDTMGDITVTLISAAITTAAFGSIMQKKKEIK